MPDDSTGRNAATTSDRLKALLLYPLPHHLISRVLYYATRLATPLTPAIIRWFVRRYGVNLADAEHPEVDHYRTFNSFFTRALKPGARPVDPDPQALSSPVDGCVSQIGTLHEGRLLQAKGMQYPLAALLGGEIDAAGFAGGDFATLYLAPRDYHRIHMPLAGRLRGMSHVPGRLFSVAPHTVATVPGLFARNERLVTLFDTAFGPLALVLVGALNVAAIETVWAGQVTPPAGRRPQHWTYRDDGAVELDKGAEMGRFNMGSTVIVVSSCPLDWDEALRPGSAVRMGTRLAARNTSGVRTA